MTRSASFTLVVAGICLSTTACQTESHSDRYNKELAAAITASQKQDYESAEKSFKEAVQEAEQGDDPLQVPHVLVKFGHLLRLKNNLSEAKSNLKRAVKLYDDALAKEKRDGEHATIAEDRLDALSELGAVLTAEKNLAEAESVYKTAWLDSRQIIGTLKTHDEVGEKYQAILSQEGKSKEAEEVQIEIEATNPEANQHILERRGGELLAKGDYAGAEQKFKVMRLLATQRHTPTDWYSAMGYISLCEKCLGQETAAKQTSEEMMAEARKRGTDPQSLRFLAQALTTGFFVLEKSDAVHARQQLEQAKQIEPIATADGLLRIANVYGAQFGPRSEKEGKLTEIEQHQLLKQAERYYLLAFDCGGTKLKSPDEPLYRNGLVSLAWIYADEDKYGQAAACYRELFTLFGPLTRSHRVSYIEFLLRSKNIVEAQRALSSVLALEQKNRDPIDVEQLTYLIEFAQQSVNLKRLDDARKLLKTITANPHVNELSTDKKAELDRLSSDLKKKS